MQGPEPRGRFGKLFDAGSIAFFGVGWLALVGVLVGEAGAVASALWLLLLAAPGLLAAEIGAGLFHWFADSFFTPHAPLIGPTIIRAFRDHHVDPGFMARRSSAEVSGQNCFACLPILGLGVLCDPSSTLGQLAVTSLLSFTAGIALTNLFHQWAHSEDVGPRVRWLQERGLILSPERHALHHSGGHDRAFCVTTGWLNPGLDAIQFFPRLERAIRRLGPQRRRELAKDSRAN